MYLGGTFTSVDGAARSHSGAVSTSGALLPFAPGVDSGAVRAIALSPDGTQVLLGGNFGTVSPTTNRGMAAVDVASGISSFVSAKTKATGRNVSATKHPGTVGRPSTAVAITRVRARRSTASSSGAVGVSGYQIRLMLHGKVVKTVTVSSRTRTTVVAGLHRRTTYQVSVRAENWAGWGSWSSAKSARTR